MRIFHNIAIIVSAYILSGSAYNAISMGKMTDDSLEEPKVVGAYILLGNAYISMDSIDKMTDHSFEELKKDEIDQAAHNVIQTGKVITQLIDLKIDFSEKISQRFKDQFMSLISLFRSNHSVYGQESKDEFDIWIFKDYKNFSSCMLEPITRLLMVEKLIPSDILVSKGFIMIQYRNIAFNFFLEMELFAEAEKFYMALYNLDKDQAEVVFRDFVQTQSKKNTLLQNINKDKPHEERDFLEKERYNTLQKYEGFYKTIRGKTQENLDDKSRAFEALMINSLYSPILLGIGSDHLKIFLEKIEPLLNYNLQEPTSGFNPYVVPRERIQRMLARGYYFLRNFDSSQQHYSKISDELLEKFDHFLMGMNLAHKGLWKDSFLKLLKADLSTTSLRGTADDLLLISEVILRGNDKKNNSKVITLVLEELKTSFPELKSDFDYFFKNIQRITEKEKKAQIQKLRQLRHQAMASQQFQDISSQYDSFDIQYQNIWAHSSFLPSEQVTSILHPLNAIAQEIQQNYELFKALEKDVNDYTKNIGEIMKLAQALRKNLEDFFYLKININDQISELKRQHNKKKSSSKNKNEDFIDFKSTTISETENLKKRICDDHKSALEQAEKKQKLSEDIQKERQQRRELLTRAYEEEQQKKSTNEITNIVEPSPFHFTNTAIQKFWETCAWETLNFKDQKIVATLKAIDAAKNMQHLRSLLTPGTKLERLSGDREGQLSLRINGQWRLCFYWIPGQGPIDINLVDYHL